MFPTGGEDGWYPLGTTANEAPVVRRLPETELAAYFDPSELHGVGSVQPAVTLQLGGALCIVRAAAGTIEAQFSQPNVWGVALLDSMLVGAPCSLELTVFDDDGVTALWTVGTAPSHPRPYLVMPDKYAEQEIDVAAGAATIGTVGVMVIDPAQLPGDQDSGWMTAKLARLGLADVAGHRCRLVLFVSIEAGAVVVADGPAGTPKMDQSYAAFSWDIRDTRDTERKLRLFDLSTPTSLLPDELLPGYGYYVNGVDDLFSDTYRVDPARPLQGHFHAGPAADVGTIAVGSSEFPDQLRRLVFSSAAYEAIIGGIGRVNGDGAGEHADQPVLDHKRFTLKWRLSGSSDPWKEIRESLEFSPSTAVLPDSDGLYILGQFSFRDRRLNPLLPEYAPATEPLPNDNDIVEWMLLGTLPPDEDHAVVLEGLALPEGAGLLNVFNAPTYGRFIVSGVAGGITTGAIDLTATPGNIETFRRLRVALFDQLINESSFGNLFIPIGGTFRWRINASSGPWTTIELHPLVVGEPSVQLTLETPFTYLFRIFSDLVLAAPTALTPADGADIEFTLTLVPPAEPLTAGQVALNVYCGLYSAREAVTGNVVPSGIRYDEAALLRMTDVVRIRITEPIEDARDWLESNIYAPTGWVPALDDEGRISPVSQVAPTETGLLPVLDNDISEPSSDWNAGERIVNLLRFTYPRDYSILGDDPHDQFLNPGAVALATEVRPHSVGTQSVVVEYQDDVSIRRHGTQLLELSGAAFRALGKYQAA